MLLIDKKSEKMYTGNGQKIEFFIFYLFFLKILYMSKKTFSNIIYFSRSFAAQSDTGHYCFLLKNRKLNRFLRKSKIL